MNLCLLSTSAREWNREGCTGEQKPSPGATIYWDPLLGEPHRCWKTCTLQIWTTNAAVAWNKAARQRLELSFKRTLRATSWWCCKTPGAEFSKAAVWGLPTLRILPEPLHSEASPARSLCFSGCCSNSAAFDRWWAGHVVFQVSSIFDLHHKFFQRAQYNVLK